MSEPSRAQERALSIGRSRSGLRVYTIVRFLIRTVLFRFFRLRHHGAEALSTDGPLLIAPVHRSNLDAPLVAALGTRRLWALSKESLFTNRVAAWFISALGAFPVNRNTADRRALASAEMLLREGEAMLVFPEGTRQSGPVVGEVFDGVAFLAARTGARVVPVAVAGTEAAMPPGAKRPRRTAVVINVGDAMTPPDTGEGRLTLKQRRAFSAELRSRLQTLLDEATSAPLD